MDFGRSSARQVEEYVSDGGRLTAWEVVPQIFVTQTEGRMEVGHAEAWIRMGDHMTRTGRKFAGIHDWTRMEAYDSATRRMLQAWTMQNRHMLTEVHLAVRSRLVRMGVTVANLALGDFMQTHEDTEALAKVFVELVTRYRTDPPERVGT